MLDDFVFLVAAALRKLPEKFVEKLFAPFVTLRFNLFSQTVAELRIIRIIVLLFLSSLLLRGEHHVHDFDSCIQLNHFLFELRLHLLQLLIKLLNHFFTHACLLRHDDLRCLLCLHHFLHLVFKVFQSFVHLLTDNHLGVFVVVLGYRLHGGLVALGEPLGLADIRRDLGV